MDEARDELLSRSGFAEDQHARVRGRGERDLLPERAHRRTLPDHRLARREAVAHPPIRALELALPKSVPNREQRSVRRERLLDEVERPELRRANRRVDRAVAGDHHDRALGPLELDPLERHEAVHSGKPDVEQDALGAMAFERDETRLATRRHLDVEAFVFEDAAKRLADAGFVVDD